MGLARQVVCPATRITHRGDYELVVPKQVSGGRIRFVCDHCGARWYMSQAQARRLVWQAMARPPGDE